MKTLGEYAALVAGTVRGDAQTAIDRIAAIEDADARTLTFAVDERYLRDALRSRAAAVLTDAAFAERYGDAPKPMLAVASTRTALAAILAALEPPRARGPYRDPSAVVDSTASIGPDVYVGPLAYVGPGARVGAGSALHAGAVVAADAVLGARGVLHPRALLLERCVAGDDVVLQAGAVVGSDGFGYVFVDGAFRKIPQIGNVELGDRVEIGANACIDRAQTGTTRIGDGTKVDNLVQIGHNVRIGSNCAFPSLTGIAGSTTIGDFTVIGGHSGVNGHITIGARAKIAGGSHVWRDVPDDAVQSGRPAQDHRLELRKQAYLKNLERIVARIEALEKAVKP